MGKLFFDVFPTLKVNKEYENLFREVEVMKVTTTSLRDCKAVCLQDGRDDPGTIIRTYTDSG